MSGFAALYASMGFPSSADLWVIAAKLRSSPSTFICLLSVETSSDIIRLMSLGTGLTRRHDLEVIGIMLGSGGLSDATGCSSGTVARGMCETGFAGTCHSGASDIMCRVWKSIRTELAIQLNMA